MYIAKLTSGLLLLLISTRTSYGDINKRQEEEIRGEIRTLLAKGRFVGHPLMAGCVRLIFHDAVGGQVNGCVNMATEDNRGLQKYLDELNTIDRDRWGISKADLWTLCAYESIHLGALLTPPDRVTRVKAMPTKLVFLQGREDLAPPCPTLEFPSANADPVHFIQKNFPSFTVIEAVALMGAHTLGKAHLPASGYDNKWVHFPDWCDNEYYKDMINPAFKWTQVKRFSPVAPGKVLHQWVHKDSHKNLMLHCDMAMWMEIIVPEDETCSLCGYPGNTKHACGAGPYKDIVEKFAANNSYWLDVFTIAINKLVNHNQPNLRPVLP